MHLYVHVHVRVHEHVHLTWCDFGVELVVRLGQEVDHPFVWATWGDIFDHSFLLRVLIRINLSHYLEALVSAGELPAIVGLSPGKKKVKHLQVLFAQCNIVSLLALMLNKGVGCEAAPLLK